MKFEFQFYNSNFLNPSFIEFLNSAVKLITFSQNYPILMNSVQAESGGLDKEYTKCIVRPEMVFEQVYL